jgi:hypothetical protein
MKPVPSPVIASSLSQVEQFPGMPEVTDISFDLWLLRVTLRFDCFEGPIYVEFRDVMGFRVLDEGELTEFWSPDVRPGGWLWQIDQGGWLDLEKTRPFFFAGIGDTPDEYLVAGVNDCVSVLATSVPKIVQP